MNLFWTTATPEVMSLGKSESPACRWFHSLESKEKAVTTPDVFMFGMDAATERAQAWRDNSDRLPVVRVVGEVVHIYTSKKDGQRHVLALSGIDVHGLIRSLEAAKQSLRVRTANLMTREVD